MQHVMRSVNELVTRFFEATNPLCMLPDTDTASRISSTGFLENLRPRQNVAPSMFVVHYVLHEPPVR